MPTAETQQGLEDEDIIMSQVRNSAIHACIHIPPQMGPEFPAWGGGGYKKSLLWRRNGYFLELHILKPWHMF